MCIRRRSVRPRVARIHGLPLPAEDICSRLADADPAGAIADEGKLKPLQSVQLAVPGQDGTGYFDLVVSLASGPSVQFKMPLPSVSSKPRSARRVREASGL